MKRIFLILFFPFLAFAQTPRQDANEDMILARNMNVGNTTTKIQNIAYDSTSTDTTQWIYLGDHANVYVTIQTKDSARFLIKYQLSVDRVALGTLTTIDSLVTTSNTGGLKSINLTTSSLGAPWARLVFAATVLVANQEGVSSATYTAKALFKRH